MEKVLPPKKKKQIPQIKHMGVSENGVTPKSSHFSRVLHYKPSILEYPYFWKHPHRHCRYGFMSYWANSFGIPIKESPTSGTTFWTPLEAEVLIPLRYKLEPPTKMKVMGSHGRFWKVFKQQSQLVSKINQIPWHFPFEHSANSLAHLETHPCWQLAAASSS